MVKEKNFFSGKLDSAGSALTFDDVLLVPNRTSVMPLETDVSTRLVKGGGRLLEMKLPVLSSPMDTVTEGDMAIAMGRFGGLGVIHRNMTIEQQCREIDRVKRAETLVIRNVVTVAPDDTLGSVRNLMGKRNITGFPVVEKGRLVGIITNRDIRFEKNMERKVRDAMTKEVIYARDGIEIGKAVEMLHRHRIEKLPLVDKKGKVVGLITVKDILMREDFPNATRGEDGRLIAAAAAGLDMKRVDSLINAECDVIVIDTAHGHNDAVVDFTKKVKKEYGSECVLIAGNIATREAAADLISAGADVVKIGVGPGSICTTRLVAGIGVPQLSAISEVADVAHGNKVGVIADGGIRYPGDIAKSMAVGADAVMMGNLFAGTDEAPGKIVVRTGKKFKSYRGMGSKGAVMERYFYDDASKFVPEGVEGLVPYKGSVKEILFSLVGGLRSSMGYCGAKDVKEMQRKTKLVKITSSGVTESHPHDLSEITDESDWTTLM